MKLRHALVILPLFLAACSNSFLTAEERIALTPAAKVFQMQGEFNILLQQVNVYAAQPLCTPAIVIGCADRGVVDDASRVADRTGDAIRAAQTAVRAGSGDAASIAAGARIAIAQFSSYLILKGVAQ